MSVPEVKLSKGIHLIHAFYDIDRVGWSELTTAETSTVLLSLSGLIAQNSFPSHPKIATYANIGGKSDIAVIFYAARLDEVGAMQVAFESCFPAGTLVRHFTYLSITELPDYVTSEEEMKQGLIAEKLEPGSEVFEAKLEELKKRHAQYEQYRLYPEMADWEIMGFYPMSKRRQGDDNWYRLEFDLRKKLMAGHARVGRKFAGRISQLITGSTGLDDYEWGVTLMAHQTDAIKEIVYEMRFDEVTARYGEFGPFYINLRLTPVALWSYLKLNQ